MTARPPIIPRLLLLCFCALLLAACAETQLAGTGAPPPEPIAYLMEGSIYETPLYLLDSERPGTTVLVLAGVHGDEPGGVRAAEQLLRASPPSQGRLLILPRANVLAVEDGVRSAPELGDLNRLYGAESFDLPMAEVAAQIVDVVRVYDVDVVIDLHESWDLHRNRPGAAEDVDTSFLGQTISAHDSQRSVSLAQETVRRANRWLSGHERFHYFRFPEDYEDQEIVPVPGWVSQEGMPNKSGLHIPELVPGVASILVEVGQQQSMEKRIVHALLVIRALLEELNG